METLSDQLRDNLIVAGANGQFEDDSSNTMAVEHLDTERSQITESQHGEKVTSVETPPEKIEGNDDCTPDGSANVSDYERQCSEAAGSADLKMNNLDIIASNSSSYDSIELANSRTEAARSHQSQHACEEPSSPPRLLSSSAGLSTEEYEQFVLSVLNVNICKNEKDRQVVEWIEGELNDFIVDEATNYKKFDEMTSYHRMLVHRVAEYYKLYHHVDQTGKAVVVSKQSSSSSFPHSNGHNLNNNMNTHSPKHSNIHMLSSAQMQMQFEVGVDPSLSEGARPDSTEEGNSPASSSQHASSASSLTTTSALDNAHKARDKPKFSPSESAGDRGFSFKQSYSPCSPEDTQYSTLTGANAPHYQHSSHSLPRTRKPNANSFNKRFQTPYTDQVPRKSLSGGGYQVQPNQGIGRYGASFATGSSGSSAPRGQPGVHNAQSGAPTHQNQQHSQNSFRGRAPNASQPAKFLRFPSKNVGTHSVNAPSAFGSASRPMSVSSNAPFNQSFQSGFQPTGYFAAHPRAPTGLQMHDPGLLTTPHVNAHYQFVDHHNSTGPNSGSHPGFPNAGVPFNWIYAQNAHFNPVGGPSGGLMLGGAQFPVLPSNIISAQMAAATTLSGTNMMQQQQNINSTNNQEAMMQMIASTAGLNRETSNSELKDANSLPANSSSAVNSSRNTGVNSLKTPPLPSNAKAKTPANQSNKKTSSSPQMTEASSSSADDKTTQPDKLKMERKEKENEKEQDGVSVTKKEESQNSAKKETSTVENVEKIAVQLQEDSIQSSSQAASKDSNTNKSLALNNNQPNQISKSLGTANKVSASLSFTAKPNSHAAQQDSPSNTSKLNQTAQQQNYNSLTFPTTPSGAASNSQISGSGFNAQQIMQLHQQQQQQQQSMNAVSFYTPQMLINPVTRTPTGYTNLTHPNSALEATGVRMPGNSTPLAATNQAAAASLLLNNPASFAGMNLNAGFPSGQGWIGHGSNGLMGFLPGAADHHAQQHSGVVMGGGGQPMTPAGGQQSGVNGRGDLGVANNVYPSGSAIIPNFNHNQLFGAGSYQYPLYQHGALTPASFPVQNQGQLGSNALNAATEQQQQQQLSSPYFKPNMGGSGAFGGTVLPSSLSGNAHLASPSVSVSAYNYAQAHPQQQHPHLLMSGQHPHVMGGNGGSSGNNPEQQQQHMQQTFISTQQQQQHSSSANAMSSNASFGYMHSVVPTSTVAPGGQPQSSTGGQDPRMMPYYGTLSPQSFAMQNLSAQLMAANPQLSAALYGLTPSYNFPQQQTQPHPAAAAAMGFPNAQATQQMQSATVPVFTPGLVVPPPSMGVAAAGGVNRVNGTHNAAQHKQNSNGYQGAAPSAKSPKPPIALNNKNNPSNSTAGKANSEKSCVKSTIDAPSPAANTEKAGVAEVVDASDTVKVKAESSSANE